MTAIGAIGRRLDKLKKHILNSSPKDEWIITSIMPVFQTAIKSMATAEEEKSAVKKLNNLVDAYEFRYDKIFEKRSMKTSLKEAKLTDHYQERKAERGTIVDIELPEALYGGRSVEEVKAKLIPILQAKLDQRLAHVEAMDLGMSNNINLGLVVFTPVIANNDKLAPIKMISENGSGHYYLVIAANNALLTMYPGSKKIADLEKDVEEHIKRERPDDVRPAKADTLSGFIYKIDIDGNEVKDVEKKPEVKKASEDSLEYKVRTDYRVGATFDHKQFGPGKVVAAASGGKAGTNGVVDWIEVKYQQPFLKGGKLQDTRRFDNVLTAAYFGKTLKKELQTMDHHAHDEHQQLRADVEERGPNGPAYRGPEGYDDSYDAYIDEASKGLWANIRAKRARGEKPARKGSEAYNKAVAAADKINAMDETEHYCPQCLAEYLLEYKDKIEEAEYRGRKVQLGKPFLTPGGPKKRSVYVKNAKGNVVKVNFGDPNLKIKKNIPARRKSFRARHKCDNPGPRWKARYWSCKAW
jgi:hypothetical protein